MKVEAFGITDVGCVRSNNEDNFVCDLDRRLFMVCDGMGGHAAGEVASQLACTSMTALVDALLQKYLADKAPLTAAVATTLVQAMVLGMEEVSQKIIAKGVAEGQKKGMGTTCTLLWLLDDHHALVAHIGDSRLYISSPFDGGAITTDHTLVEELVARGLIGTEEARRHPQAHILSRALGASGGLGADCFLTTLGPGDSLLLCSDGLHGYLPDLCPLGPPWTDTAGQPVATLEKALQHMIEGAKAQGGHDNLTGVLVHLPGPATRGHSEGATPLHERLRTLALHPALQDLPTILLRRLAAYVVPVQPRQAVPGAGIFWPTTAPILAAFAQNPAQPVEGSWFAPEPLGSVHGALSLYTIQSDATVWHLPADALHQLCRTAPALGATILGGLLQPPSIEPHGAAVSG